MWKMLGNVIEMFVYAAVYVIIALIALKIVGSTFTTDFEKKISEEGNTGLSIICACILIGMAIILAAVLR